MLKKILVISSLWIALASAADPIVFVQGKDNEIQTLVKADPTVSAATEAKLKNTLLSLFDPKEVAKNSLGKDKALWDRNANLQERFAQALSKIIIRQNVSLLKRSGAVQTTYTSVKKWLQVPGGVEVMGSTMVKNQKKPISYLLIPVGNDWKAVDIKIGNISTYNYLIQQLLKKNNGNFEGLIKELEAKAK